MSHTVYGLIHYDVGDLVYYRTGHLDLIVTNRRMGVIKEVFTGQHFPRYVVFWFNDNIFSEHLANNLDLVYNRKVD